MASVSQFSLEEENFYKDIQDLVKNGSQNEKGLSTFLQRYMDLLARADLDDECFIINFKKAALILEASTKVYGTKVDRLWINLERVLEALKVNGKTQNSKKKGDNEEEVEDVEGEIPPDDSEPLKKLPNPRRRRKLGDGLSSSDDFVEIDNISGLLGKNMNESDTNADFKIKFHEEIPNLFIRNKTERKRIDVCLVQISDDRDDSRLRDWIVAENNMLVKEKYIAQPLDTSEFLVVSTLGENYSTAGDSNLDLNSICNSVSDGIENEAVETDHLEVDNVPDDANNNLENVPDATLVEQSLQNQIENEKYLSTENRDKITEALNRSQEVDVGKFPNIFLRRLEDCLVDVNEVFWDSKRFQDVIPSRKMRIKKTHKTPCALCRKKVEHFKKSKNCHAFEKNPCLDSYFSDLAQPVISDPPFGILPDEELYKAFKIETKLIEQLGKVEKNKNIGAAYHPEEENEEPANFLGFDGFENHLMRKQSAFDFELLEENVGPEFEKDFDNLETPEAEEEEIGLPLPTTENSIRQSFANSLSGDNVTEVSDSGLQESQIMNENLIREEMRKHEDAKSKFERNKELGMRVAQWHLSLVSKIELSQKRGALNVDQLAGKILSSFPESDSGEKPVIPFHDLVKYKCRRDIPRYFFACLQLTNEGNIDILKSTSDPLKTDCMMIKKLQDTRVRQELDEYTTNSTSPKKVDKSRSLSLSSNSPSKRKRNSDSISSDDSLLDEPIKKKVSRPRNGMNRNESRKRQASCDHKTVKKRKENFEL